MTTEKKVTYAYLLRKTGPGKLLKFPIVLSWTKSEQTRWLPLLLAQRDGPQSFHEEED